MKVISLVFIKDLEEFFTKHKFEQATWGKVHEAMMNDPGVQQNTFGNIFIAELKI